MEICKIYPTFIRAIYNSRHKENPVFITFWLKYGIFERRAIDGTRTHKAPSKNAHFTRFFGVSLDFVDNSWTIRGQFYGQTGHKSYEIHPAFEGLC